MTFEYSQSGLPQNQRYEWATIICKMWLDENMTMFNEERRANFMMNQPINAAKLIMENCENWTEESIIAVLLGPAKAELFNGFEAIAMSKHAFGQSTMDLIEVYGGKQGTPEQERDAVRLAMVEAMSGMYDQIIDRKKIDGMHHIRWKMLNDAETLFSNVKGQNPKLDVLFEDAMVKSRQSLEALDAAAKNTPKPPKM